MKFSPQQQDAISAVNRFLKDPDEQVFRLFGYAGTGKEQPVSCMVKTPIGPRRIGDIKVGDEVFGANGKPTRVVGVFPQGRKRVYRVAFRDGFSTRCGAGHLWLTSSVGRQYTVRSTQDMQASGVRFASGTYKYQIPLCAPVEYDSKMSEWSPYLIGALIGDGYLSGSVVTLCMPDEKSDILSKCEASLPEGFKVVTCRAPACPRHTLCDVTSPRRNRLRQHLNGLGLLVKSPERFIPKEMLAACVDDRIALLRGLMDTDGSVRKNRTSFSTVSKRLAFDLADLVQSLGGTAIVHFCDRGAKGVEFSVNVKTTFNPFYTERKASRWSPSKKNPPSRYITSIEEDGEEDQVCIKVASSDELYLTDHYIVTHNTTLARHMAGGRRGKAAFAAFTGKAAKVLQSKGCQGASTIHSLIYAPKPDKTTGIAKFVKTNMNMREVDLVVIDECSMVGEDIAEDLLSFGKKVLVLGDPAQLPPVKGGGFFTEAKPDFMLDEVHRQAAESLILRLATSVRKGKIPNRSFKGDGVTIVSGRELDQGLVTNADTVLVGRNATRHRYNARLRELKGYTDEFPEEGELLICLKNDSTKGLLNGGMWTVAKRRTPMSTALGSLRNYDLQDVDNPGFYVPASIYEHFFQGEERVKQLDWRELRGTDQFNFGYAITVHKSQGSQWDNVCLFNESGVFRQAPERWLYTGITRAAKHITLVI